MLLILGQLFLFSRVHAEFLSCKIEGGCYEVGEADPTGRSDIIDATWIEEFCRLPYTRFDTKAMCEISQAEGACKCGERCVRYGESFDENGESKQAMPGQCGNCTSFPTYQACTQAVSQQGGSTPSQLSQYAQQLNKLQADSVPELAGTIIKGLMGVLGTIALVMMLYAGVLYMTARGNSEQTTKARDTILWAGIGIVVIFASYALVDFIFEIFR